MLAETEVTHSTRQFYSELSPEVQAPRNGESRRWGQLEGFP